MTDNRNSGNFNESPPYVVGILSPSTTLYIDQMPDNREITPPNDLNLRRRNNSFQITSVTVQGSRKNDEFADDSADDLDESHTDDLSSDILDSSRADNEGYHSEDVADDLSPCGPIIFAQVPSRDPNMNLSLGVTPTFTAIGPSVVAGGVTMMTSKSESPISAQVPIMNPLPDNWQRRFKVVKIVSSEPFRRGRWLCMDFKDPPPNIQNELKPDSNGTSTPPTIQVTDCDSDMVTSEMLQSGNFAQVYEIPINQTFNGNFIMGDQQQMYGIILPQNEHLQPVTLVQDLSLQTTVPMDRNFNNIVAVNNHSIRVHQPPPVVPMAVQQPVVHPEPPATFHPATSIRHVQTLVNNCIPNHTPPSSVSANNNYNISQAVPNHVLNSSGRNSPDIIMRTSSGEHRVIGGSVNIVPPHPPVRLDHVDVENTER